MRGKVKIIETTDSMILESLINGFINDTHKSINTIHYQVSTTRSGANTYSVLISYTHHE
jgi:hypothetical protein